MRAWIPSLLLAIPLTACMQPEPLPGSGSTIAEWEETRCAGDPGKVDVLIVIDDSASMAEELETLARNLEAIAFTYAASVGKLDYRIAVTTTDVANPYCASSPEDGALQMRSCREHLEDFVVDASHESPALDVRSICTDYCPLDRLETVPTTTSLDDVPKPRPWLQRDRGQFNLPEDVSSSEALTCMGLAGVAGCTYESPLEAAYLALQRARDSEDPAYGFLRDDAALFVMFVTDEDDCSVTPGHHDIFTPEGSFALGVGADPPTSAVCWAAGVACTGRDADGVYEDCRPQDKDAEGNPAGPDDALLRPTQRYLDLLAEIERAKQLATGSPQRRVFSSAVTGVPDGYASGFGPIVFADAVDSAFQTAFGIGPGCVDGSSPDTRLAIPPPRIREVIEAFGEGERALFSTCDDDYTPALACIPGVWRGVRNQCIRAPSETHRAIGGMPECTMAVRVGDEPERFLAPCEAWCGDAPCTTDDSQMTEWRAPSGEEGCVAIVDDSSQSGAPADDMSDECIHDDAVAEAVIIDGTPGFEGHCTRLTCSLALP